MLVNKVPYRSTKEKINIGSNKLLEKCKKVMLVVLVVFVVVVLMSLAAVSLAIVTTMW
jgi:hypothetical protein